MHFRTIGEERCFKIGARYCASYIQYCMEHYIVTLDETGISQFNEDLRSFVFGEKDSIPNIERISFSVFCREQDGVL